MKRFSFALLIASALCANLPAQTFTPSNSARVYRGYGVPQSSDCSFNPHLGRIYVREDAAATYGTLYVCAQVGFGSYGWEGPYGSGASASVTQNGLGAVARTLSGKVIETVSVTDFGAVNDNATNSTATFQSAVDYLCGLAVPGGVINIPPGPGFVITGSGVNVTCGGIRWRGNSSKITFTGGNGTTPVAAFNYRVVGQFGEFSGINLYGALVANTYGIRMGGATQGPGTVLFVPVVNGGTGYSGGAATLGATGGCTGAAATQVVTAGVITGFTGYAGTGCTSPPVFTPSGAGSGAVFGTTYISAYQGLQFMTIRDVTIANFGDATHVGAAIQVEADTQNLVINHAVIVNNYNGVVLQGPTDSLHISDSTISNNANWQILFNQLSGASGMSIDHNNLVGTTSIAGYIQGISGGYLNIKDNEIEHTVAMTGAHSAAIDLIGMTSVSFDNASCNLHSLSNYCIYVGDQIVNSEFKHLKASNYLTKGIRVNAGTSSNIYAYNKVLSGTAGTMYSVGNNSGIIDTQSGNLAVGLESAPGGGVGNAKFVVASTSAATCSGSNCGGGNVNGSPAIVVANMNGGVAGQIEGIEFGGYSAAGGAGQYTHAGIYGVMTNAGTTTVGDLVFATRAVDGNLNFTEGFRLVSGAALTVPFSASIQPKAGIQYITATQPACTAATRGTTWYVAGATTVKDTFNVCAKNASDVYAWAVIY